MDETSTTDDVLAGLDLRGKRVLVTGVSAGLGVETARALAAHGAHVVGTARDLAKAKKATAGVRDIELVEMDLASLKSVRAAADALVRDGAEFDIVIANAGVMAAPFGRTADGFETQFGTNHLGHFVFINRIEKLIANNGRIVIVASSGHRMAPWTMDDLGFDKTDYDPWVGYARSKTANILFAVELDRRLRGRGIRATSLHPGGIQTELGRHIGDAALKAMADHVAKELAAEGKTFAWKTIPQGAATSVWAATAPGDEVGGRYCEDCQLSPVVEGHLGLTDRGVRPYALDPENARALWTKSEQMVNERFSA